ncbi:hypothetical protein J7J41_02015 [bacterium]|nr:hypothetical protein [bacterium]
MAFSSWQLAFLILIIVFLLTSIWLLAVGSWHYYQAVWLLAISNLVFFIVI